MMERILADSQARLRIARAEYESRLADTDTTDSRAVERLAELALGM